MRTHNHDAPAISVADAVRLILSSVGGPAGLETIPVVDALGRRVASDMASPLSSPPFDNSAMDGFAIVHPGSGATAPFTVTGLARAGAPFDGAVGAGEAVKIMTGARVPSGADTVVMKEWCSEKGGRVTMNALPECGANVRRAGEDIRQGTVVMRAGMAAGPVELAALATMGHDRVGVFRRPVVSIITTGTELCTPGQALGGDQIYDSNSRSLAALARLCGAEPRLHGIASDEPGQVAARIGEASGSDVIVTTGGVSVGDYDFVKAETRALGCEEVFWGVAMRPGRPAFFGLLGGKPVFGLPGNAVSSMVTFEVLVKPAVLKLGGDTAPVKRPWRVRLARDVRKKKGVEQYVRARVTQGPDGMLMAEPAGGQGSHQVFGMGGSNALCVIPAEADMMGAGSMADAYPFGSIGFCVDI
ncbi:MAG: gephyrin-like molybdotransferase Glp [Myxococcota bacterium]